MSCGGVSCRGCQPLHMPDGQTTYVCPNLRLTLLCTVRTVRPKTNCPGVRGGTEKPPKNRPTPPKPAKPARPTAKPKPGKEVPPKKPTAQKPEKPAKVRTPKPEKKPFLKPAEKPGTKRPGGRGQKKPCIRTVPAPPQVSRPQVSRPAGRPWTPAIAGAVAVLFTVGLAARHGAAIATTIGTTLGILALLGLVILAGGAAGVALAEGLDWSTVRPWWERRQAARAAVKVRRAELEEAATSAIALGPVTQPVVEPVTERITPPVRQLEPAPALAVDPEVRKWTDPTRAVPDYKHLYQVRTGRKAR